MDIIADKSSCDVIIVQLGSPVYVTDACIIIVLLQYGISLYCNYAMGCMYIPRITVYQGMNKLNVMACKGSFVYVGNSCQLSFCYKTFVTT